MILRRSACGFLAMLTFSGIWSPAQEPPVQDTIRMVLRARFPASGAAPRLVLEGRTFQSSPLLPCFYERRGYVPAWSHDGVLRPAVGELFSALAAAGDDGLRSEDYRTAVLRNLADAGGTADLDLLLSDAFLTFAAHLRNGKVNPEAIYRDAELNQRAEDHVRQIEVNLERWRWLPHDLGQRHVLINIAAFRLDIVEDGRTALAMRVIVGKPYTRTPMFSSALNSVVLNPSWNVPRSIVPEVLARARRDPSYLQREGFETLPGPRLRQRPGQRNALGRIKFVFLNRFGVYLHDTSAPALFGSDLRTFSHGCIRVEKPFDLAVWALRDDPRWTAEAIHAGIEAGQERTVPLPREIPVHVAYWTAWVGDDGTLRLGRDVYQRDAQLARLLQPVQPLL